jgi:hypothetical protein
MVPSSGSLCREALRDDCGDGRVSVASNSTDTLTDGGLLTLTTAVISDRSLEGRTGIVSRPTRSSANVNTSCRVFIAWLQTGREGVETDPIS